MNLNNNENKKGVLSMSTTVQNWGNSLGVRIPKQIAKKTGVRRGTKIAIQAMEDAIILKPIKDKPTLEELLEQCTEDRRHEEMDFGLPVGRELI